MEKEQTTPAAYPMTVNALRAACNQKTNRNPVTSLGEVAVRDALEALRRDVLVWRSAGARVEHWEHRLASRWQLDKRAQAVMTLLILRGPQTPGELRTRSARMIHFDSVDQVVGVLRELAEGEHPMARELVRAPGQRETRWCHLVGTTAPEDSGTEGSSIMREPPPPAEGSKTGTEIPSEVGLREGSGLTNEARIAALESRVRHLDQRLDNLEKELT